VSWDGQGSTRAWRRVRALVLERDHHRCQLRGDKCTSYATHVHHLVEWTGRPEHTPLHLMVAACPPCNIGAGAPVPDPTPTPRTRW
jgi:5-methylcytosine-specific restriction endonuclease McrA